MPVSATEADILRVIDDMVREGLTPTVRDVHRRLADEGRSADKTPIPGLMRRAAARRQRLLEEERGREEAFRAARAAEDPRAGSVMALLEAVAADIYGMVTGAESKALADAGRQAEGMAVVFQARLSDVEAQAAEERAARHDLEAALEAARDELGQAQARAAATEAEVAGLRLESAQLAATTGDLALVSERAAGLREVCDAQSARCKELTSELDYATRERDDMKEELKALRLAAMDSDRRAVAAETRAEAAQAAVERLQREVEYERQRGRSVETEPARGTAAPGRRRRSPAPAPAADGAPPAG